jgi:hypothetical protein
VIPQNEQKARTVKALYLEEKQVLFQNFNNILPAVSIDPTLWTKPEFQPQRDFNATVILGNPQIFAHALPNSHEKKKLDGPMKHPLHTKALTRSLSMRDKLLATTTT